MDDDCIEASLRLKTAVKNNRPMDNHPPRQ